MGLIPTLVVCAWAQDALKHVEVVRCERHPPGIVVQSDHALMVGTRLLLVRDAMPIGWAQLARSGAGEAVFVATNGWGRQGVTGDLHGWLVPPDYVAKLLDRWPADAELYAEVDSLGPGGRTAWLRAGGNQGVRAGDCWWLRFGGQPAARCDVLFVAADVCYCTVVPLARDFVLRAGSRVALWPAPGQRRTGRMESAVAYTERRGAGVVAWIAAPPTDGFPPEPHLDFFHDGIYTGYGAVERRDERFWYVRFNPLSTTVERERVADGAPLRVGDRVTIRTQKEVAAGALVARVFELTPTGAAITAGEDDRLSVGQELLVFRAGRPRGKAVVRQVQRSYAVVTPADELRDPPLVLQVGDELRLRPPAPPSPTCGRITMVVEQTIFTAQLTTELARQTPLGVRLADGSVGVAVLVQAADGTAIGFALPCSLSVPLEVGAPLLGPVEADSGSAD